MDAAPFLNLIVAPNGCGKSALVCGIIIGLAGDVSLTGRSGDLAEYVKFGCETGSTDIELKAPSGRNYRIQRKLNVTTKADGSRSCRSEWLLNGKTSKEKEVKAFVSGLSIAVDNLCQCLPQERVVEFVKMNSKELLQNTEKAVGEVSLFEDHQLLIGLSAEVSRKKEEQDRLRGNTEEKEKQNERDEEEIKRLNEKKQVKDEIKSLALKKPWLEFEVLRQQFADAKIQCEALLKKKKKEESLIEPYLLKVEEYSGHVKQADRSVAQLQKEIDAAVQSCKKLIPKVNQSVKKADELVQEFKSKVSDNSNRQAQIVGLKAKIRDLENELNNRDSEQSLMQRISVLDDKMSRASASIAEMLNEKERIESESGPIRDGLTRARARLRTLDAGHRRREHLRQLNLSAYKGLEILQEMKRDNAFNQQVYPPMMIVIDVIDPQMAMFVESCIPRRDLFAFVFEDDDDLRKFSHEIASRNVRCALIRAPPPPDRPPASIGSLRRLGFQKLATDLFTAPVPVKDYLCTQHNMHMIPIGDESASRRFDECDKMGVRTFFAGLSRYTMNRSRYDGSVVTTSQPVQDAKILTISADTSSVEKVKEQVLDLEEKIEEAKRESGAIDEGLKRKEDEKTKIKEEKKVHANELQEIRRAKATVELRRQDLQAKESNTFDEQAEKVSLSALLRSESQKSAKYVEELVKQEESLIGKMGEKFEESSLLLSATTKLRIAKKRSEHASARLKNLEQDIALKENRKNMLKKEAKELRRIAEQQVINSGYKMRNGELPADVRRLFEGLPDTAEEVDAKLKVLYLKMHSMVGVESESAMQDFELRKKEIAQNREQLQKLSAELEQKQAELATVKERWLQPLKKLMQRIDDNFSRAMKGMGHAGDVLLRGEGNEFSEYGIVIRVKYRDNEELQELSAYHQSGGERSVATVIYMMALQELTKVPFRCIDEINQGMDAANERKIFDLIVDTAMKNSSQYFLLSPKLLLGLKYSDKMQIHCIQNGRSISENFIQNL